MEIAYKELFRVNRPIVVLDQEVSSLKDSRKAATVRLN